MFAPAISNHANTRIRQRGIRQELIEALFSHGDTEASVGGGCTVVRLSRRGLRDGGLRETLGPLADRLPSLAMIIADDTGEIVTVMHDWGHSRGSRYRPWA